MYNILKHSHSGLRYVVLALLIASIIIAYRGWKSGSAFKEGDRKIALFAMISVHIQLLIGLALYFISPLVQFGGDVMGNSVLRFYSLEHILMMAISIILITIGHSKSKKMVDSAKRYKTIFMYYLIAFILIMLAIPWPMRDLGSNWF